MPSPADAPVWTLATLSGLPPLESLRFFEAAARHESFARAAAELGVTAAAVAYHVRALEAHLDAPLFERRQRGVLLNPRGQAHLKEIQHILAEVHGVSERHRRQPRRVRIISVEAVAEKWLVPRLAALETTHPGIAIELETDHRGVDPGSRDFDAWIAYTGATAAPRPLTRRADTLIEETLYEELLLPVCSPALLAARGQPRGPAELDGWPCSTTWAGTPTGRTGRPARTSLHRTSRGPRASACTACWSTLPSRGSGSPSGVRR